MTLDKIEGLIWPENKDQLARLSISEWQQWYLAQDSTFMIHLGQEKDFKRFVFIHYTLPVRALRCYYKIKRMFV